MHTQTTADTTRTPDAELVQSAKSGNEWAYQQLVERYQRRVITLALGILHDRGEAEDIAQEAFARVFVRLDGWRGDCAFYTWLYRITVNLAIDRRRRLSRHPTATTDEWDHMPDRRPGPQDEAIGREFGQNVQAAIQELSPEHRAVLILRAVDGLPFEEIADTVGCTLGTALSRMHYARQKLREKLQKGEQPHGTTVRSGAAVRAVREG